MKQLFSILFIFLPVLALAQQVNFEDGFTNGNFTANPTWTGDDGNFIITTVTDDPALDGNPVLRLNAPAVTGSSYLSTPSSNVEGHWEFFVRMDFAPSATNLTQIFLMSDTADLSDGSPINGYALRGGENGSNDVFRLFKMSAGTEDIEVLTGTTDISTGGSFRVKVTRDATGNWTLEVAEGYDGILAVDATGVDNSYTTASHFGVRATYTSTRSKLFYFDFKIDLPPVVIDPLLVNSFSVVNNNEIDIAFSKDIDATSVSTNDFELNPGAKNPASFTTPSVNSIRLTFVDAFLGGENQLSISGDISDLKGDTTLADTTFSFFLYDAFEPGDVVINEIMYDQPIGTPEYVELKNTTGKYLNLKDWKIGNDKSLTTTSNSNLVLYPDSFVVFTTDAFSLTNTHGEGYYFNISLPRLVNTGDQVRVYDNSSAMVDSLQYSQSWGGTKVALERRSSSVTGTIRANWGDSPSPLFGTPGKENLIEPDTIPPEFEQLLVIDNEEVILVFSEAIKASFAENLSNYTLSIGQSSQTGLASATLFAPDSVSLKFNPALPYNMPNNPYSLVIERTEDVFGNASLDLSAEFVIVDYGTFEPGDVVINEIMYDQPIGTPEYVELKNNSNKNINLKDWTIGNDKSLTITSNSDLVLYPDSFVVFTTDSPSLTSTHGDGYYFNISLPTLVNGGDRVRVYDNNGAMVDSLRYAPSWGGTKVALERRSSSVTGTIAANWGNSPSPLLGTPGKKNLIEPDTTPPDFKKLIVVDNNEIILIFSEAIKADSAESLSNYTLSLGQESQSELVSATLFASDSISLKFSPALPYNLPTNPNSITIKHVEDFFGNTSFNFSTKFMIVDYGIFEPGDVVINEIMYDQPTGTPEYVELKNNSNKNINLKDWTIGNDKSLTITSNSDLVLYPDSFVVFTTDASSLTSTHGDGYYFNISLPTLVNGGDRVRVYDNNGAMVDSLQYDPSWGGTKIALERINSRLPSTIQANWGNSPSPTLGTPGKRNAILPGTEGPKLKSANIVSQQSVKLTFDQFLEKIAAENLSNYSTSNTLAIQSISAQGEVVTINFSDNMVEGEFYTLTILNQADIFGNITPSQTTELRYLDFVPASSHDVVINEIMYLRSETDDPQFVELFNRSTKNIDLSDWILRDAVSDRGKVPQGTVLAAGEYLVLTDKQYFAETISNALYISGFPSLNTTGDATAIIAPGGVTVDSLYYTSAWGGDKRISLERKDPFAASNDASNWATSTAEEGSTPGTVNSQYQEDTTPPRVIFANQTSEGVFVAFSEFISIRNDTEFRVSDNLITNFKFDSTQANELLLYTPTSAKLKAANIEFEAINLYDVKGNKTATFTQPVASSIEKGSVVINEILFEPLADANDNLPDQAQYIELYNPTDYAISLEGLVLTNAPDENNNIRVIEPVSSSFKWIPAKKYMLIYAENVATQFKNSKTAIYFDMENQSDQFTMRVNRTSLSLRSTGDAVYIADSTGAVIDSVIFSRDWHNPNKITTKGTSLERINPEGPSNEMSNWSSSTDSRGGTPGSQNSIYQSPGTPVGSSGISFSSNPFSPDNDGFEDHLFINYELDHADYLLHVRIFDRYGRKVRTLADGKAAGFSGSLIWDGLTDDRKDNRVGIYIILFEAYNSAAGKKQIYKETVVLARKF